ncbi:hypothetical protein FVE88_01055 [Ectopseudomonas mendocina]|nr:hypothetical protein [Pseudomonas mendocina]TXR41348.1 hypothetical protein FVE88_01055 [Pseudomonas mendocina]
MRWPPQADFDCAGTLYALKTLTNSFTLRSSLKAAHGALCRVPIRLQAACHGRCAGVEKNGQRCIGKDHSSPKNITAALRFSVEQAAVAVLPKASSGRCQGFEWYGGFFRFLATSYWFFAIFFIAAG